MKFKKEKNKTQRKFDKNTSSWYEGLTEEEIELYIKTFNQLQLDYDKNKNLG